MNWTRQVVHVMHKDAQMFWWYLVAYAALVAIAAADAMTLLRDEPSFFFGLAVMLGGAVFLTSVVHADSPILPESFWATRPLAPGAVLTAKVLLSVLALVGIAAIGQAAALQTLGSGLNRVISAVSLSSFVYVLWLTFVLVIAVVTPDLRTFLLALVAYVVATQASVAVVYTALRVDLTSVGGTNWVTSTVTIAISLLIAGYIYRTRNSERGRMLVMAYLAAGVFLTPLLQGRKREDLGPVDAPVPARAELRVMGPAHFNQRSHDYQIELKIISPPEGYVYELVQPELELQMADGSVTRPSLRSKSHVLNRAFPRLEGVRWPASLWTVPVHGMSADVVVDREQRAALLRGAATLHLKGQIRVHEAVVAGKAPARPGATLTAGGRKRVVISAINTNEGPAIELSTSVVRIPALDRDQDLDNKVRYALVDHGSGLAFPMQVRNGGGSSAPIVMLGAQLSHQQQTLGLDLFPNKVEWPSTYPLSRDSLVFIDWQVIGSYPVSVRMQPHPASEVH